jgi:tripeptide aminopeptidase
MKNKILEYFIKYVKIDTMSMEDTGLTPSTNKQFDLANILADDLKELGLININIDQHAFVTAMLPSNVEDNKLSIGFIAHMDTIPGFSGTNVKPNVIYDYDGKDIELKGISLTKNQFPFLKNLIGKTLITTDGTTVLGADDKAGIADIMGMLYYFKENPNVPHCEIMVAFTPDEEIGEGIEKFNLENFKCDFAYTVDGGAFNEINYENFNAASATVYVKGLDIHPGSAKNQMINASLVAMEFNGMLNVFDRPEYTEGYEGFNHLCGIEGVVGEAKMFYILRNHNKEKLEMQKNEFLYAQEFINKKYNKDLINVVIKDSYSNMAEYIKKDPKCLERATNAMKSLGFKPDASPIRGGTDGARLTLMGLNTPNLGTGGYNCHGPYEMACLEEMELVAKLLIEIAKI